MQSLTQSIFIPKKTKYKILTFPTHEGYQSLLDKTGHEFYMLTGPNLKGWDHHTRPLPPNHYLLSHWNNTKVFEDIDLVLIQSRDFQYELGRSIAQQHNIPVVQIDHTQPPYGANHKQIKLIKQRTSENHVYITNFSRDAWGDHDKVVIPHGIDQSIFSPKTQSEYLVDFGTGVSVVNQFANRDVFCGWNIWKEITQYIPVRLFGENPGISKSINNAHELATNLKQCRFFLNTSQWSPVPLSLLEAMACGLPIVTTAKQEIPNIIKNGHNGLMSDDPKELIDHCKTLIEDPGYARYLGDNAAKTIKEKFSLESFVNNWNNVFKSAVENKR